jgi:hypothetical protein
VLVIGRPAPVPTARGRRRRRAAAEPQPAVADTARVTVIDVGSPFVSDAEAARWLASAGDEQLSAGLAVLNRALLAERALGADPYLQPVSRTHALVARAGYGAGEEVADGRWRAALELTQVGGWWTRRRAERDRRYQAQAELAAALGGRAELLVCEELTLRARLDLDLGRRREAALQLKIALDTALAELAGDATPELMNRVQRLADALPRVSAASEAAITRALSPDELAVVERTLADLEATLRARAL